MTDPNQTSLISEAFVKCCGELENVAFDTENALLKNKYASLAAISAATRPILAKHGLAMRQEVTIRNDISLTPEGDGMTCRWVTVKTEILHLSGQTMSFGSMTMPIGEGGQSEVQAAGSLISYMRRYAWLSALGIAGEKDDDGNSAPKPPTKTAQASQPLQASEKTRLWALNKLQAAPGQPNRSMVLAFFSHRGWIKGSQTLEDWPLAHVPNTSEGVNNLAGEIQQFDVDRHKQS